MTSDQTNRRPRAAGPSGCRGMTLLEVVLAIATVALLASTVLGAVTYMHQVEIRQTHQLATAELANRMMLQYLDDKSAMPSPITPLEYGAHRYRWSLSESPVGFEAIEVQDNTPAQSGRTPRNAIPPERRYKLVTVRVWLSEESGGSLQATEGVVQAQIGRLIDLLAFRNPDSAENLLKQPGGMQQLLEAIGAGPMQQLQQGGRGPTQPTGQPTGQPTSQPTGRGGGR